jgi:ribosome biogenesis GTPase
MKKVQTGLVIEFYSNSCLVRTDEKDIPCIGIKNIIVGDIVKIKILQDSKETKGVILSREDRKSLLQKKDGIKYKNIAANLSHVGILVTPKPKTTAEFIDKWILTSLLSGIEPFIICNKSDLSHDDAYLEQINLYKSLDIQTFSISAKENTNIDLLQNYLKHKCALFVGNSGAGKSTLTSLITGKEIKTSMLSNNQGVHTTSISTLYQINTSTQIIDSPGVRDLPISGWKTSQIIDGFKEIYLSSKECEFNDCNHINNQGCNVIKKLNDGEISQSRYNNFIKFRDSVLNDE